MNFAEAKITALGIDAASVVIEVEGMKTANVMRERAGSAPAYGEDAFEAKRVEMANIANTIRGLAERLPG